MLPDCELLLPHPAMVSASSKRMVTRDLRTFSSEGDTLLNPEIPVELPGSLDKDRWRKMIPRPPVPGVRDPAPGRPLRAITLSKGGGAGKRRGLKTAIFAATVSTVLCASGAFRYSGLVNFIEWIWDGHGLVLAES